MALVHSSAGVYVEEIDQSQSLVGTSPTIGAIVGESDKGPLEQTTLITTAKQFLETFGKPDPRKSFMHYCALAFLAQSNKLYVTRVNDNPDTAGMVLTCYDNSGGAWANWLSRTDSFDSSVIELPSDPLISPLTQYSFTSPNQLLMFCAVDPGAWGNTLSVEVKPITNRETNEFVVQVYLEGSTFPAERFIVTIHNQIDGYGVQSQIEEVINRKSSYIRVLLNREHPLYAQSKDINIINTILPLQQLGYGRNGSFATENARTSAIIGGYSATGVRGGWELYTDVEEIDVTILINGGYTTPSIQRRLDQIAQGRMDAFAVLDMPANVQGNTQTSMPSEVAYRRNDLLINSCYSAIYSPNLHITDPYNGIDLYVPPSGHVAGAFALTDRVAATWFAPAGIRRGTLPVNGASCNYNQGIRDAFADHQVNPIRTMKGYGIVIWAADTLQSYPSALSNIGVRRLVSWLEKSISDFLITAVFDPNDAMLRASLTAEVDSFLGPIRSARGLDNYQVVCNDSNNPPSSVANGDLILDVYVDPTVHTKRIHLNAVIARAGGIQYAINLMSMSGQSSL